MANNNVKVGRNSDSISYLNQREAAEVDEILMGPLGFSVDQLMVSNYPIILGSDNYFNNSSSTINKTYYIPLIVYIK